MFDITFYRSIVHLLNRPETSRTSIKVARNVSWDRGFPSPGRLKTTHYRLLTTYSNIIFSPTPPKQRHTFPSNLSQNMTYVLTLLDLR